MTFCSKCGSALSNGAKFCSKCGAPLEEKREDANSEERVKIFDGDIHKCPNCGEVLKSFEAVCPTCDYELRGVKASKLIKNLNEKLEEAKNEQEKTDIIKNFPVPNTKEDLLEFAILASTNFDAQVHFYNQYIDDVSDGWLAKLDQCAMKADVLGDPNFSSRIKALRDEAYNKITKVKNKEKRKKLKPLIITVVSIIIFVAVIAILIVLNGSGNSNTIKVGISSDNAEGEYYEDLIEFFEVKGFTNIEAREDGWNLLHKSGKVKSVIIDGKDEFYSFSKFSKDVKIIILYYS